MRFDHLDIWINIICQKKPHTHTHLEMSVLRGKKNKLIGEVDAYLKH